MNFDIKFQVFLDCQDRKIDSSIRFLGEVMARQFCFEIYWPLADHFWLRSLFNWKLRGLNTYYPIQKLPPKLRFNVMCPVPLLPASLRRKFSTATVFLEPEIIFTRSSLLLLPVNHLRFRGGGHPYIKLENFQILEPMNHHLGIW